MSIGSQLKKARQRKHLSLDEVYKETKIYISVLKDLEDDRFGQRLDSAYIRSFLVKYASYLGLDTRAILQEYDNLSPGRKVAEEEFSLAGRGISFQQIVSSKITKAVGIIAASALAFFVCLFLIRGAVGIIHKVSQRAALHKERAVVANPAKPQKQKAQATNIEPLPAGEKLKLTITAADNVWVQLKADGKIISQNVIRKGSSESWEAEDSFTLWTAKAEAMQLNLNGNDLGTPGEGAIRGIVLTREGIRK